MQEVTSGKTSIFEKKTESLRHIETDSNSKENNLQRQTIIGAVSLGLQQSICKIHTTKKFEEGQHSHMIILTCCSLFPLTSKSNDIAFIKYSTG